MSGWMKWVPEQRDEPGHRRTYLAVAAFFVVLTVVAIVGAYANWWIPDPSRGVCKPPLAEPQCLTVYQNVIASIWVTIIMVTPALCLYLFSAASCGRPLDHRWRAFWSVAYLAFLAHLYWTAVVTFHLDFHAIFDSMAGPTTDPSRVVQKPGLDFLLALIWGIDVALAWAAPRLRWLPVLHFCVHVAVLVIFLGAFVGADKASAIAKSLGAAMAVAVLIAIVQGFRARSRTLGSVARSEN